MKVFQLPVARPVPPVPSDHLSVTAPARTCASVLVGASVCAALLGAQTRPDTVTTTLLLGSRPCLTGTGRFADVQRVIRDARAADSLSGLRWTSSNGTATPATLAALAHLRADPETGRSEQADVAVLDSLSARFHTRKATPVERGLFDVAVDVAIARHAFVHRQGLVDPSRVHAEWSLAAAELDLIALRNALAAGGDARSTFAALEPQTKSYQLLVAALAEVRQQDADTTQRLPAAPARAVSTGGRYADAQPLALVLQRLGELPARFDVSKVQQTYSKPLSDAIARWQNRKLKRGRAAGTLTPTVLAKLMDEYETRGERIALAIERWRWLPRTFSNDPLVVNLPEYRLHTYSRFQGDSADPLSMNVVIGRADSNATPVFSANMTQVVFSPRWHVPKSIMLGEIGPAAARDSGYLAKHNYELTSTSGRLLPTTPQNIARIGTSVYVRQRSGDDNSLGKVKFLLPNPYDIYLHDTPSRSLFSRNRRDFSHGCVRLGNPMAMARYVLAGQPAWTDSKITEAMNANVERFVRVPRPIPVLIVYQTAVADPDGSLRYFNDVYGHDRTLADALEKVR
jgi:L,D-transpeptidase YcbB